MHIATSSLTKDRTFVTLAAATASAFSVLLRPDWFLPNPQNIDEWIYLGLAHDYWEMPESLNYKVSRLPWVLLLSPATRARDVDTAFLALQGALLFLSLLAIGLATLEFGKSLNRRTVALGVVALGSTYFGLSTAGGAAYHTALSNPLSGAIVFVAIFALVRTPTRTIFFLWGVLFAVGIHTNIHIAFYTPALVAITIIQVKSTKEVFGAAVWALLGSLFATAFLGLIAAASGQAFLFWALGLRTAIAVSQSLEAWYVPLGWEFIKVPAFQYLILPFAAVLLALLVVTARRHFNSRGERELVLLSTFTIVTGIVWLSLHALGILMLAPSYFAAPLQVPSLMLLGVAAASGRATLRSGTELRFRFQAWSHYACSRYAPILFAFILSLLSAAVVFGGSAWASNFSPQAIWAAPVIVVALIAVSIFRSGQSEATYLAIFLLLLAPLITPSSWHAPYVTECRGERSEMLPGAMELRNFLLENATSQAVVVVSSSAYQGSSENRGEYRDRSAFAERCVAGDSAMFPLSALFTIHDYSRYFTLYFSPGAGSEWAAERDNVVRLIQESGAKKLVVIAPDRFEATKVLNALILVRGTGDEFLESAIRSGVRQAYVIVESIP